MRSRVVRREDVHAPALLRRIYDTKNPIRGHRPRCHQRWNNLDKRVISRTGRSPKHGSRVNRWNGLSVARAFQQDTGRIVETESDLKTLLALNKVRTGSEIRCFGSSMTSAYFQGVIEI